MKIKCDKCGEEFKFIASLIRRTGNVKIKVKCINCGVMIKVKLERRKNENKTSKYNITV